MYMIVKTSLITPAANDQCVPSDICHTRNPCVVGMWTFYQLLGTELVVLAGHHLLRIKNKPTLMDMTLLKGE